MSRSGAFSQYWVIMLGVDAIDRNYKYFQDNLADFLANPMYENKFLIISKEKVQRAFDTFSAAFEHASAHFIEGEFIIQEVIDESKRVNIYRSAI